MALRTCGEWRRLRLELVKVYHREGRVVAAEQAFVKRRLDDVHLHHILTRLEHQVCIRAGVCSTTTTKDISSLHRFPFVFRRLPDVINPESQ